MVRPMQGEEDEVWYKREKVELPMLSLIPLSELSEPLGRI